MHIFWYGESCFKIQSNKITILIDPETPKEVGLRGPNFKSDILILSTDESRDKVKKRIGPATFLISGPGEYEIQGVFIEGISFLRKDREDAIYRIVFEEINLGFLGRGTRSLDDQQVEKMGLIDLLFVPITEKAEEIINSIEPKIIIPHSYQIPGLNVKRDSKERFLKKLGRENTKPTDGFSLKKNDLVAESSEQQLVVLNPKV